MKNQETIEEKIKKIKRELDRFEVIRPGSISSQQRERGGKYSQLSYSHKGKGHTEYVRPEHVEQLKKELADYKRLKELVVQWIDLSIEASNIRRAISDKKR
jgi:hypothetical protein